MFKENIWQFVEFFRRKWNFCGVILPEVKNCFTQIPFSVTTNLTIVTYQINCCWNSFSCESPLIYLYKYIYLSSFSYLDLDFAICFANFVSCTQLCISKNFASLEEANSRYFLFIFPHFSRLNDTIFILCTQFMIQFQPSVKS
jgi:hypothetical protein